MHEKWGLAICQCRHCLQKPCAWVYFSQAGNETAGEEHPTCSQPLRSSSLSWTRCSQTPQSCHCVSNTLWSWCPQLKVLPGHGSPLHSPQHTWGLCPATGYLGVDPHMLGQRFLGISDISALDTGLYAYRAPFRTGVSNFRNCSISSNTEQLEPVPLVLFLNLVC